jgi:two-component system cell cycle sensor histidine kinase/response regulator CckA
MDNNQGKKGLDRIDSIERQIQTGASLTRQLLGYARKGKYRPAPLCLNPLVQEALTTFGRTRKALTINFDLLEDLPRIHADRGQMELVLLNLLINASDAMPDGGTLTVSTDIQTIPSAEMQSPPALGPGDYVHLRISDTGIGMDKKRSNGFLSHFLPPRRWDGEPGWGWRRCMAW